MIASLLFAALAAAIQARTPVKVDSWEWQFEEIDISALRGTNFNSYVMAVFRNRDGQEALYVGANNGKGCELWRSTDGKRFTRLASGGLKEWGGNDKHKWITSFAAFNGELYVGTWAMGAGEHCKIFRSADGVHGTVFVKDGFASEGAPIPNGNLAATYMLVHQGKLFVGVYNPRYGPQLWRHDGRSWKMLVSRGQFGKGAGFGNTDVTTLAEFQGRLYLSTENPSAGTQIWRKSANADLVFEKVNSNSFGELFNNNSGLMVSGNELLAHTWDFSFGSKVYRYKGNRSWASEVSPGFGDPASGLTTLYQFRERAPTLAMVGAYNPRGFDLWSRFPGGEWARVARPADLGLPSSYTYVGTTINWKRELYMAVGSLASLDPRAPMRLFKATARPHVTIDYTKDRTLELSLGHPKSWLRALRFNRISLEARIPSLGWT
ncbi:MAG: hypothetical protein ACE5F1_17560, partial [Planctomycetota bacterium]